MVAVYTGDGHKKQTQNLASSLDRGRTWAKFAGNPVLDINSNSFRDPKVFWHKSTGRWIMATVLADDRKVRFWGSKDLKAWENLSDFGPAGSVKGVWECPELFEVPVESGADGESRWVLKVDVNDGAPFGGSGGQYFVGRFDGREFRAEGKTSDPLWIDLGKDFYASQTWNDAPGGGRPVWIAWMNNWQYANDIPTSPWRGAMTIARSVSLCKTDDGFRIVQSPVESMMAIRKDHRKVEARSIPVGETKLEKEGIAGTSLEIIAEFDRGDADEFGLKVRCGDGEETLIGFDRRAGTVFVDRTPIRGREVQPPLRRAALREADARRREQTRADSRDPRRDVRRGLRGRRPGRPYRSNFPEVQQPRRQPLRERGRRPIALAGSLGIAAMRFARWLAMATVFGTPSATRDDQAPYSETYRPQFHFSPKSGWIGDPDGLIHHRAKYHLFWWGHAESTDLVHWEEKPYPMKGGDGSFTYYTGSVIVDNANTSGMGRDGKAPLIAVYTANHRATRRQTQCLSASLDGDSFQYFAGNPVLDIGSTAFRDPDVFWHEPTRRWIMAITLPIERKVHFYGSGDLKSWTFLSEFGPMGARDQLWEVPNLLRLPLDGDGSKQKWALVCGMGPNKAQFFVGDFDGSRFRIDPVQHAFLTTAPGLTGEVFADSEAPDCAGWTPEGDAFETGPDAGGRPLAGYLGKGLVSTRRAGPRATGRLLSPPFTSTRSCINFLIGGGHHPGETCVDLVVDGEVVRTATGGDSDTLMWSGWDVADWKGKRAQLRVVDRHQGDWANITVDHILFSDVLMDQDCEQANWIDWGPDFYAVRAWRACGERDERTVWMGWMGNWDYARDVPTSWGKGAESIPREVRLASAPGGYRIHQSPIPELMKLRREQSRGATRKIQGDAEALAFHPGRNC